MSIVDSIPLSLVASQLSRESVFELSDMCIFRNYKLLLCARSNVLCIYKSAATMDPSALQHESFTLHQIIQDRYIRDAISSVTWCKSGQTAVSEHGEFIVASGTILTVYAPLSLMSISPNFDSFQWDCRGILGLEGKSNQVCISEDSTILVVGGKTLSVFKRESELGDSSGVIHYVPLFKQNQYSPICSVAISPDNRFIATVNEASPFITLWYYDNGEMVSFFILDKEAPFVPLSFLKWMPSQCGSPLVFFSVNHQGKVVLFEESSFCSELLFRSRYSFSMSPSVQPISQWAMHWLYLQTPRSQLQDYLCFSSNKQQLNIDTFLQGCKHEINPLDDVFFDFPSSTQFLVGCVNESISFWRVEQRPPKLFSIPSLQITPCSQCLESPLENIANSHIFMTGFGTGIHDVDKSGEMRCLVTLLQSDGILKNVLFSGTYDIDPKSIVFENSYRLNSSSPFVDASVRMNDGVSLVTIDSENQVEFWKRKTEHFVHESRLSLRVGSHPKAVYSRGSYLCLVTDEGLTVYTYKGNVVFFVDGQVRDVHMMGTETPGISYICGNEFVMVADLDHPSPVPFDAQSLHHPKVWNAWTCIDWDGSLLWLYRINVQAMKLLKSMVLEGIRCYALMELGLVVLREVENMAKLEVYDLITTVSTFHLRQEIDVIKVDEKVVKWNLQVDQSKHCLLAAVNGFLFAYLQSHGRLEFVGMASLNKPIVSVGFDAMNRIVAITSNEIWSSGLTLKLRKPIQYGNELIKHCSLLRLQVLMDTSEVELTSHSCAILLLLRAVDYVESQLKKMWKKVNPIRLKMKEQWRWCEEEERVKQKVELRVLLNCESNESLTEKELKELDNAFQYIDVMEWDEEEKESMRKIIRILIWRKQAMGVMDLDDNAMQYLLAIQLGTNKLAMVDFVPSFALLFASFSNSKDTLMNEALTLLTKARLGFSTIPQPTNGGSSPIASVSSPAVEVEDDTYSAASDRYKSLFTFTSNRSNLTVSTTQKVANETIYEDEDMMRYVTWEEVRLSGMVLWCKSRAMYQKLAMQIATNQYKSTKDPYSVALFYVALKKLPQLAMLFKIKKQEKLQAFFCRDFSQEQHQKAALKNAFILQSRHDYSKAAIYFLLAGHVDEALQIIVKYVHDPQLALFLSILIEGEDSSSYRAVMDHLLAVAAYQNDTLLQAACYEAINQPHQVIQCLFSLTDPVKFPKPSIEISRYFLDNHSHCSCFPRVSQQIASLLECSSIFLLQSIHYNPRYASLASIPLQSFVALARRVIALLFLSRRVAASIVVRNRLMDFLRRMSCDVSSFASDPLLSRIPTRRVMDLVQFGQYDFVQRMKFPYKITSFSQWYATYSCGSLHSLLTTVAITSHSYSTNGLVRSLFDGLLNDLSEVNCANLRALCNFSLSRKTSIHSILPLLQNTFSYRSWWLSTSSEEPGKMGITRYLVEATHMQVLLGLALIGWEQWDSSLLLFCLLQMQKISKEMASFQSKEEDKQCSDEGNNEKESDIEGWDEKQIQIIDAKGKKQIWVPYIEGNQLSKTEMAALIAVNLLRTRIIESFTSSLQSFTNEWSQITDINKDSSLLQGWNRQIACLTQLEKNLLELLLSCSPDVLTDDIETIPIYFNRFSPSGVRAFTNPSLQRLWEEMNGNETVARFIEDIMPKPASQPADGIQRKKQSISWKWKNWNASVKQQRNHTITLSSEGDFTTFYDHLPNSFVFDRQWMQLTQLTSENPSIHPIDAMCPFVTKPACLVASYQQKSLSFDMIRWNSSPQFYHICSIPSKKRAIDLVCNSLGSQAVAVTKDLRGILFDIEKQSVDQQYSIAKQSSCVSSGFYTSNVGYHITVPYFKSSSIVSVLDYRQDCSIISNRVATLQLPVPVLRNSLSVVLDSTIVLSTEIGLLYLDLRQKRIVKCIPCDKPMYAVLRDERNIVALFPSGDKIPLCFHVS